MSTTSLDLDLSLGFGEPIICLNTSCNYPFGRICSECANELDSRARARARAQSKSHPDSNNRNPTVQPALSRSTTMHSRSHDIRTRVADLVEDLQEIFAFIPAAAAVPTAAPAIPQLPSKLTMQNLQILDVTPSPLQILSPPHSLPPFSNLPSLSRSTFNSSDSIPAPLNPLNSFVLNFWLNDIVLRTLEGQVLAPAFTGGAEEKDELEAMCPYCDASMGEGAWRELHLINFRYAHIEAEKLEIVREKVLERVRGW
ncbi:uncharacterized protein EAE97_009860 [Botrytis byssoidea]|uniref:Uncharacterized protein n=1 Tax=Botrytis byssoidea TaxID=139641 RepID=A0A9P5I4F2_9HELO|nr:uncharacterized protein EAE97_009860 [Botrytis byssoidea]KAF7928062.1 hypothetical protein EAE97_009860 [Botrytis byssoidea]